jgi:alcohol dehydrogenase class IV
LKISQHRVLRCNQSVNAAGQSRVAQAMRCSGDDANPSVMAVVGSLGQPATLEQGSVRRDQLDAIAHRGIANYMVRTNPKLLERPDQTREIFYLAW